MQTFLPFLPCRDSFEWKINLMIVSSTCGFYEIYIVPSPHFNVTITNRNFRASPEASGVLAPLGEEQSLEQSLIWSMRELQRMSFTHSQYMCKWPYLAVPQLCREMLQPLKVFVSISRNAFFSVIYPPLVLGERLSQPYFCLTFLGQCPKNAKAPQCLGTHRITFSVEENTVISSYHVKLLQGCGILCISPWSVTGMLWSPNIVIIPVLSHPSVTFLLSERGASIKTSLFQAEQASGR